MSVGEDLGATATPRSAVRSRTAMRVTSRRTPERAVMASLCSAIQVDERGSHVAAAQHPDAYPARSSTRPRYSATPRSAGAEQLAPLQHRREVLGGDRVTELVPPARSDGQLVVDLGFGPSSRSLRRRTRRPLPMAIDITEPSGPGGRRHSPSPSDRSTLTTVDGQLCRSRPERGVTRARSRRARPGHPVERRASLITSTMSSSRVVILGFGELDHDVVGDEPGGRAAISSWSRPTIDRSHSCDGARFTNSRGAGRGAFRTQRTPQPSRARQGGRRWCRAFRRSLPPRRTDRR